MLSPSPTMRTLAAEAGVSPMAVSLALRGSREISAATRQRILRLAHLRGYRPDPALAQLMHRLRLRAGHRAHINIAGLVSSWPNPFATAPNFLTLMCEGIAARAARLGYAFSRFLLDDFPTGKALQRVLRHRGIEGLIWT